MLKPNEAILSAEIAAECVKIICTAATGGGRPPAYRNPEQISLILDMVNQAIDAMLPLEVPEPKCGTTFAIPIQGRESIGNDAAAEIARIFEECINKNTGNLRDFLHRNRC